MVGNIIFNAIHRKNDVYIYYYTSIQLNVDRFSFRFVRKFYKFITDNLLVSKLDTSTWKTETAKSASKQYNFNIFGTFMLLVFVPSIIN